MSLSSQCFFWNRYSDGTCKLCARPCENLNGCEDCGLAFSGDPDDLGGCMRKEVSGNV